MSWLWEDPTTVLVAGAAAQVLLAVVLWRTGRVSVLAAMGGVAAIVGLLFLVERWVVTPREEIEGALADISAAVEANDVQRVIALLAPEAAELAREASVRMPQAEFRDVRVTQLKVVASGADEGAKAEARFLCRVEAQDRSGQSPYENFFRRLTVYFRKQGGQWFVTGYKDEAPFGPNQESL